MIGRFDLVIMYRPYQTPSDVKRLRLDDSCVRDAGPDLIGYPHRQTTYQRLEDTP